MCSCVSGICWKGTRPCFSQTYLTQNISSLLPAALLETSESGVSDLSAASSPGGRVKMWVWRPSPSICSSEKFPCDAYGRETTLSRTRGLDLPCYSTENITKPGVFTNTA